MIERPEKKVLTVSALTQSIKFLVEANFPFVWVEGEISNLREISSGTTYFTLKDETAQIRAVLFKINRRYLRFQPEDGMYVVCQGRVSVYEARGEYQLIIDHIEPRGVGALQQAFLQLKERLEKEGLFAAERKKKLPLLPDRIAVISSLTGAALYDFLRTACARFANVNILIYPARVQGEGAAKEMAEAILGLNRLKGIDVIVLTRGGGSFEDLWAFNEDILARAISASKIPVVSAVGHEIDFTIADFVADVRAATPTAAAELVVPKKDDLSYKIDMLQLRLTRAAGREHALFKEKLAHFITRLARVRGRIQDGRLKVDTFYLEMRHNLLSQIQGLRRLLDSYFLRLGERHPREQIRTARFRVDVLRRELEVKTGQHLAQQGASLRELAARLEGANPVAILGRGYSITELWPDGKILRDTKDVAIDSPVRVRLSKGKLFCRVEKVTE
ncbi:MAG: exodeoxyribonuclease VII large subunit [Desulfovibrionales bacterium]|nr:exodeoxyribonuclease VII large subunit [Desulfovibrionales bacterium]